MTKKTTAASPAKTPKAPEKAPATTSATTETTQTGNAEAPSKTSDPVPQDTPPAAPPAAGKKAEAMAPTPLPVVRLDVARALDELPSDKPLDPVANGIRSFKDADGRTMKVVVANGQNYKQEV
ncbi:MAG: hypothetical protein KF686_03405 [Ramlibacter sp.]|nr:hypothetical protein [Ramlibacter sp.]